MTKFNAFKLTITLSFLGTVTLASKNDDWKQLSVVCQNVGFSLWKINGDSVAINSEWHKKERSSINEILNILVNKGDLVEKKIQVKPMQLWDSSIKEKYEDFFEKLGSKYGKFVAAEMLDIGFRRRQNFIDPSKKLEFHLRVPKTTLIELEKLISKVIL